jgi:hypothetical protein
MAIHTGTPWLVLQTQLSATGFISDCETVPVEYPAPRKTRVLSSVIRLIMLPKLLSKNTYQ